jgi:hypothetical protein
MQFRLLELQKVHKNLHAIQSILNVGCFINIFVSICQKLDKYGVTIEDYIESFNMKMPSLCDIIEAGLIKLPNVSGLHQNRTEQR